MRHGVYPLTDPALKAKLGGNNSQMKYLTPCMKQLLENQQLHSLQYTSPLINQISHGKGGVHSHNITSSQGFGVRGSAPAHNNTFKSQQPTKSSQAK